MSAQDEDPVQKCMNSCMDSVKKFTDQIMGKAPEQKQFDDIKEGPPPQMDMGPAKPPQVIKPDAPTILVPPPKPAGPGTPAPRPATNPNDPRPEGRDTPAKYLMTKKGVDKDAQMQLFGREYGEGAKKIMSWLTHRSTLEDPRIKSPSEPWMFCWEEVWDPHAETRDKDGEKCVGELARIVREKKKGLFIDPVFPPNNTSLFASPEQAGTNAGTKQSFRKDQDPFLAGVSGIEWKRPSEICRPGETPVVFSGTISPDDVAQGRLGNCYFLAAISACGIGESDSLIKDLCIEDSADVGMYGVKFFVHGKWITVVIDDLFPCVRRGDGWQPIFASPKSHQEQAEGEMELWSMIFEKAWAKFHMSYENTAGGHTGDTHNYLTGGSIMGYDFDETPKDQLWKIIVDALDDQDMFVSCAGVADVEGPAIDMGLITGHAYSVLKAVEASNGERLVQIRNPWGQDEWNGTYSDSDSVWTPQLSRECGHVDQNDGTFFMSLDDFCKWFGDIEVCDPTRVKTLSETTSARLDCFASNWVSEQTAGGPHTCSHTFKYNPTCELTVTRTGKAQFSTYKRDARPIKKLDGVEKELQPKVIVYLKEKGSDDTPQEVIELHGWQRMASSVVELTAGVTYQVICSTWAPGVTGMCWVTVAGHGAVFKPSAFEKPTPGEAMLMKDKGLGGKMVCVECRGALQRYFNMDKGPMCPSCHTAARRIICAGPCRRDIQGESYYSPPEGKMCVSCYQNR